MMPLLISSGEPAGIGPDLCVMLAAFNYPVVIIGDVEALSERAQQLELDVQLIHYQLGEAVVTKPGSLSVIHVPCYAKVESGILNIKNASYVLELLEMSASLCKQGHFSGLVTAPVHKAVINDAGHKFTGHTEFFETYFQVPKVVMMLACKVMKVALITTHLPLKEVSQAITMSLIMEVMIQLNQSLKDDFGIKNPFIKVAGLNPHAGESGHLGLEEIEVITPALNKLRNLDMNIEGPLPADTMYIQDSEKHADAYVAMYHDQGLPLIKYLGFKDAVNITLGLPIIRTSVDHGTALNLAGTGKADPGSLIAAIEMALTMSQHRSNHGSI